MSAHSNLLASNQSELYIGLMSGTSMDAMDAVLVDLSATFPKLIGQVSLPMPGRLRTGLLALCQSSENV